MFHVGMIDVIRVTGFCLEFSLGSCTALVVSFNLEQFPDPSFLFSVLGFFALGVLKSGGQLSCAASLVWVCLVLPPDQFQVVDFGRMTTEGCHVLSASSHEAAALVFAV